MNSAIHTTSSVTESTPIDTIGVHELRDLISGTAPVIVAEILGPKYFDAGHLPGAKNLPLEGFETTVKAIAPHKGARIVVYCASITCANSDIAARKLRELGYSDVLVFRGGKAAWADAGFELVKGAS